MAKHLSQVRSHYTLMGLHLSPTTLALSEIISKVAPRVNTKESVYNLLKQKWTKLTKNFNSSGHWPILHKYLQINANC